MTRRRRQRAMIGSALAVAGLLGCQFIVSEELPAYSCAGTDPSACPGGMVCDPNRALCINKVSCSASDPTTACKPEEICDETLGFCVAVPKDDGGVVDARRDGGDARRDGPEDDGAAKLGQACNDKLNCAAGLFCATSTILTTKVTTADSPICSKPCCTSEQCDPGFVCFGVGTGGNYCVAAKILDRPTSGTKQGGLACAGPNDCRSGLCIGRCRNNLEKPCVGQNDCDGEGCVNGACGDTCCKADDCAGGSTCRVTTGVNGHAAWACGTPNEAGAMDIGEVCSGDGRECKNNNCVAGVFPEYRCTPTCCTAMDCENAGLGNTVCTYGKLEPDYIKWCFDKSGTGNTANGQSCTAERDCQSRYCDPQDRICMQPCCTDANCAQGERCVPSASGQPYLRCKK